MVRWEYNTIAVSGELQDAVPYLDVDGAQGWEVVHVQPSPQGFGFTYLMKRALPIENFASSAKSEPVKHNHSIDRPCRASCSWFGTSEQLGWDGTGVNG